MNKERYEEIITELVHYRNMASPIDREEISRKIKRYKEKLKSLKK